jgi:hypothetical protein
MSAKFKSKTHLLYTFLIFGAVFARLASKFKKSTNMTFKKFLKKITKVSKIAEFHANFKSVENFLKK